MIKSVRLVNFFSFGDCTIDLESDLNVLVGINGSGKSNFLRAFQLLKAGLDGRLKEQIVKWGGYASIENKNPNHIDGIGGFSIEIELDAQHLQQFGFKLTKNPVYLMAISNIDSNKVVSVYEHIWLLDGSILFETPVEGVKYYGADESSYKIVMDYKDTLVGELVLPKMLSRNDVPEVKAISLALHNLDIYRIFNTIEDAPMRTTIRATGIDKLLPNGDNMFQVLNTTGLKSIKAYDAIESGLHDVNENFQRFRMNVYGQGSVEFYLQEEGLETPIHAAQISDGTLCYLCLLVALHQPDRGNTILFDEPERNLHPDMLFELGKQLEKASEKSQIILTTHAPGLVNQFPLRAVRVFEKDENNQTIVNKFTEEDFAGWYDEFAPGQMWRDGALGGNR